jgi:hypothetical protein
MKWKGKGEMRTNANIPFICVFWPFKATKFVEKKNNKYYEMLLKIVGISAEWITQFGRGFNGEWGGQKNTNKKK